MRRKDWHESPLKSAAANTSAHGATKHFVCEQMSKWPNILQSGEKNCMVVHIIVTDQFVK
jgi:hypothetical protein